MNCAGISGHSYEISGNLTGVSRTMDGVVHTTGFEYDADDRLSAVTYPSGRRVDYTRNAAGEVTSVTSTYGGVTEPIASSIVYAPFGPLVSLNFGNGLNLSRIYDLQYRLTDQVTNNGATPIEDLALLHDPGGNIDQIADASDPTRTRTFDYDALDRLISDTGDYGALAMSYDPVGNRQSLVIDDGVSVTTDTLTYSPSSNRLSSHNALAVMLDAAGNTLDDARGKSYTYGDHGRLLTSSVSGTLQATYAYDGHGQRIRKLEATGAVRQFHDHYSPAGEVLAQTLYDSAGTLIEHRDHLWLDGMPLAQATGSTIVFLHTDQLDTPRLATDAAGTVVWRWASDGFGVGAADEDPDGDGQATVVSLRFPGQYFDPETGLHYNYYRTYDPSTGRYLESDPIGLSGGLNTYGYAFHNPLLYADPTGEVPLIPVAIGAGRLAVSGYRAYRAYRSARTAATAAAAVSAAAGVNSTMNEKSGDRDNVIPFPSKAKDSPESCSASSGGGLCNLTQQIKLSAVRWSDPEHDGSSIPGLTRWRCEYFCPNSGRTPTKYITNRLGCTTQITDTGY